MNIIALLMNTSIKCYCDIKNILVIKNITPSVDQLEYVCVCVIKYNLYNFPSRRYTGRNEHMKYI